MSRKPDVRTVAVGERQIAFEAPRGTAGQGFVVLLIHGASMNRRCWRGITEALAERHTPIAIDLPGHGKSKGPACGSVEELASVVGAVHDALNLQRVVLVGHSLGGGVVQLMYHNNPAVVEALGLLSTGPTFELTSDVVARWRGDARAFEREQLARWLAPNSSSRLRRRAAQLRADCSAEARIADLYAAMAWRHPGSPTDISVPALLVAAQYDSARRREDLPRWADALPAGTFREVRDAGHLFMVEQPRATSKILLDWLEHDVKSTVHGLA